MTTTTAPKRTGGPGGRTRGTRAAPWLLLAPFLALFALTIVIPVLSAVVSSFTRVSRAGVIGEGGVTTEFAGFANYEQALSNPNFIESFGRVLLYGVVQVSVMIVFATVLALLLESASARWPAAFRGTYFLPYGIPGVLATIMWAFLYVPGLSPVIDVGELVGLQLDFLGPDTVLWSIANIVTWTFTGYNMLIIIAQLKSIPDEVYEAAKVDGAGPFRLAISVQLPLIRPALVLTGVFSIIGTIQLFAEPQVLAASAITYNIDSEYTPNMAAYTTAFAYNDYNVAAAQSVVIALVAFILSFLFLRLTSRSTS